MTRFSRARTQKATYWAKAADDGYGGSAFGTPVVLTVRWEERSEDVASGTGELIRSHSVVWSENRLQEGGYLFLGESIEANPTIVTDASGNQTAYPIRRIRSIPTVRGKSFENVSFL